MGTSDTIALLALVISLISFWLSYRAAQLSKKVIAAEKRTQSHSILIGVLLEAEELLSLLRDEKTYAEKTANGTEVLRSIGLGKLESKLKEVLAAIPPRLDWLRSSGCDDPVLLEEYKTFSVEVESRVKMVAPQIRGLRESLRRLHET